MDAHDTLASAPLSPSRRKASISITHRTASLKRLSQSSQPPEDFQTYTLCLFGYLQNFSSSMGAIKEIPMQLDAPIREVCCGLDWLCILTEHGRAYSFGSNTYGQLAQGHTHPIAHPKPVLFSVDRHIARISCGTAHGGFIVDCGALFMFGCGSYGRLGTGNEKSQSTPVAVRMRWKELYVKATEVGLELLSSIPGSVGTSAVFSSQHRAADEVGEQDDEVHFVDISCGDRHTLVLGTKSDTLANGKKASKNHIIAFGDGMNGRLGLGSETDHHTGVLLTQFQTSVASYIPTFSSVHAGSSHNAAVTSAGELFTWGNGADGQLGHGGQESEWVPREVQFFRGNSIVSAKCGSKHTAAISRTGVVYTWGRGLEGQLGTGQIMSTAQPQRITLEVDPVAAQQAQIEAQLAAGASFSSTAASSTNALALQDTRVLARTILARNNMSMALDEQFRLFVWGDNSAGQLGLHGNGHDVSPPLPLQSRVATPKQLLYMDLREPKKLASRVRDRVMAGAAASLPRVALTHVDLSDQFSVLVFRTKATVNGLGQSSLEASDKALTSVSNLTHKLIRQRSSLVSGLDGTVRWELSLTEPLHMTEIPSREAAFYNYMAQYKVLIRPKTPNVDGDDHGDDYCTHVGDSDGVGSRSSQNKGYHGRRRNSVMSLPSALRDQLQAHFKSSDDGDEAQYSAQTDAATSSAAETVRGFNAWLERHTDQVSPAKSPRCRPIYQFGSAVRFPSAKTRTQSAPSFRGKQTVKTDQSRTPNNPVPLVENRKPRPPKSAFGRCAQPSPRLSISPAPSCSGRRPTTAKVSSFRGDSNGLEPSEPSRQARQKLFNQFVAPFGSSVSSRFGMSSPRANDLVQLDIHPESCALAVYPRSPGVNLGSNAEHFSESIGRRLTLAKGCSPGPGAYNRDRG